MLSSIRAFFSAENVLEVDTPVLSHAGNTDPCIESFSAINDGQPLYLHTSPEFPMKRLLAAGSGDIYQLCKVFRQGERGKNHNLEFTLLEWYRLDIDHHELMDEVADLISHLAKMYNQSLTVIKVSYRDLFKEFLEIDPLSTDTEKLQKIAHASGIDLMGDSEEVEWLDLLISHCVMPKLPTDQLTLLYDYPASQASLARINADGLTAARFEVFWGELELANGFHELKNADEQAGRFKKESIQRQKSGQTKIPIDENLIEALREGLPDSAGVALGIDRLMMKLLNKKQISDVIAFPVENA